MRLAGRVGRLMFLAALLAGLAVLLPRVYTSAAYGDRLHTAAGDVPAARVAVVFGAGLRRDGQASPVLRERVAAAADLYHAGKVSRLLLSGDNRVENYNEPAAMRQAALASGVPPEHLVLDYAGRSTYDTCYRAQAIFGLDEAVLVTQGFHLPRALYACNSLGLDAHGFAADGEGDFTSGRLRWRIREVFATAVEWWDLTIAHPLPVLGDPIVIP